LYNQTALFGSQRKEKMEQNNIVSNDADLYLIEIPDACIRLGGISNDTIYKHIRNKSLKTVKLGRRRMVSNRAINEFIDSREG